MNEAIGRLLRHRPGFLADAPDGDGIAVSTRVRLARNLAEFPFPTAASAPQLAAVREAVTDAVRASNPLGDHAHEFLIRDLAEIDREVLFERRLASRELLQPRSGEGALFVAADESASVMVNEEDHIRIQAIGPGCRLDDVYAQADRIESRLAERLRFAFDERLGHLTSCPTNVGTGMRASVMLHLPGLVIAGRIDAARQGVNQLHCTVRGLFGEGSDNRGNLFQVSNQCTLGLTEQEILTRLGDVIRQLIEHERDTRARLLEKDRALMIDFVGRSYGLLRHAYKLTQEEAMNALSGLRLGVDLGLFRTVDRKLVNELFLAANPAHLAGRFDPTPDPAELDARRADLFRERLRDAAP